MQQPDFRLTALQLNALLPADSQQPDDSPEGIAVAALIPPKLDETERWQNAIKMKLRQHSGLYRFLVYTIGTALLFGTSSQRFVDSLGPDAATLSVGAGVLRLNGQVTHLDYEPYPHLEVVGDANYLPFADNTFDGVVCETLLEHVVEPERVIAEMFRVLKPGGKIYILMPFLFGFHAAPNDFHRMTHRGLEYRMRDFEIEKITPFSGPASALNNVLVEFLALLCSFGSRRLYRVLTLVFLVLCSPIKLLDFALSFHPEAMRIASILLCIAQKPIKPPPVEI
jgi:SAM-dependent methyltransferase